MDQDEYVLFIDETGTANPKDLNSPYYVLAGCVVKEGDREKLKTVSNNIKFKYWNNTDIVFHSSEIGRKQNSFSIFRSHKRFTEFLEDLEYHLFKRDFRLLYVLVDKEQARTQRWNDQKIYKETSDQIIKNFLCFLLSRGAKGKVVIESATAAKDFYFLKSLSLYLSQGIPLLNITHVQTKQAITSISFVTKNNFDTEEQIADLFAYAAKCHYMEQNKKATFSGKYEQLVMKILDNKLLTRSTAPIAKPKYAKHVSSQVRIP